MFIPIRPLARLSLILLLTGCIRPPVPGNIDCTQLTPTCKEFVTIEGVHVKFSSCVAHIFRGHMNAIIYCTISNPAHKDLLLRRSDFRIVSLDGVEMVPDKFINAKREMPDEYALKSSVTEDYVFSAHTKNRRTEKDFKEFMKTGALAFLHQGGNLVPDTFFTMQWMSRKGSSVSQ